MLNLFLLLVALYAVEVLGGLSQAVIILEGTANAFLHEDDSLYNTLQAVFDLVDAMLLAQEG